MAGAGSGAPVLALGFVEASFLGLPALPGTCAATNFRQDKMYHDLCLRNSAVVWRTALALAGSGACAGCRKTPQYRINASSIDFYCHNIFWQNLLLVTNHPGFNVLLNA